MTQAISHQRKFAPDDRSEMWLYDLLAAGLVPEPLIRIGVKCMLREKLKELDCRSFEEEIERTKTFAEALRQMPVAVQTDEANRQHYEVPTDFFRLVLGPRLKYSCCYWDESTKSLAAAEERMLEITCDRAQLANDQSILELGCGWGSLTLFAAARYPSSSIVAVSNSSTQRTFIEQRARELGLKNIQVITADVSKEINLRQRFDRIVSVEMFEHLKNYETFFKRLADWLRPEGKVFAHIFSHKRHQYHFNSEQTGDWLSRYFFSGGTMPSDRLFYEFSNDLVVSDHWTVSGQHYQKTAESWLTNMQKNKSQLMEIIAGTYGNNQVKRWWVYWRLFFIACAELWGFRAGNEWLVSHYLFEKRQS